MIFRPLLIFVTLFALALCQEDYVEELAENTTTTTEGSTVSSDSSTAGSSEAPCQDDPSTDCASLKNLCTNSKYTPMLKAFCPVTCNMCPGATTPEPPTADPNCHDNSSNCVNWVKNGFCSNCFYKCSDRIKNCAKSCGFCTPGSCKDCTNMKHFMKFIEDPIDLE
ncbi:ShKT domain-containing protein [Caenorhabditis elegans]|uniref:ShKT domain-containing protein n=1 Tax=Caenorhabditis elegans TaxID=6239 RepID=Q9XVA9_CAEEL|nr:ShKT domain-containing protein [Caenorhabditis elegans]CAB04041.1 ShKT domain-containing protein [Caenorhabditis elegans]|eukprot:NP_496935.1 Uncharacterized protein CELE_F01D5.5 [Caenorhabditis elegans]